METDLKIYAKGLAFERGVYDLRSLEVLVSSYRSILDRLVAVQLGRRQLPGATKRQLNYDVKIQEGSLELLIDFALEHPEVIALFAEDGGHQLSAALTRLYRGAIDLRKAAAKFIEQGLSFNIIVVDSFNIGSNNNRIDQNQGQIAISDPKFLWAAQASRFPTDRILRQVDGKNIEYVDLLTEEETMRLDPEDRTILGRDKEELNAEMQVVGRLDMIAFSAHKGVIVSNSESFPVTWDEQIRSKMQSLADIDGIVFKVRPVVDNSRLHRDAIGFHVLDCHNPNEKLL